MRTRASKPAKMSEIESREGKSIIEILHEKYETYGNQSQVAKAIGVSQGTLSLWLMRLDLVQKIILVPKSKQESAERYPAATSRYQPPAA